MIRKLSWSLAAGLTVMSMWAVGVAAQVNGTVVLKSGERHSGSQILYRLDRREVSVRTGANTEPRVNVNDVAYVDFGGTPDVALNLTGSQEAVVLKDGTVIRGQVIELGHETVGDQGSPFLVIIRDSGGQEQRLNSNRVGRVYFAGGGSATTATTGTATPSTASTAGGGVVVNAKQQWTSTGLIVRRGETVSFNSTGEVTLTPGAEDVATPAGAKSGRMAPGAPLPRLMAGGLIGRVGNGQPFAIGNLTTVVMPAAGQLFLGVNDDHFDDNSGEFRVEITRSGIRR